MVDVTDALIQALVRRGVKTVYGVPGDFVLGLFKRFEDCKEIETVCMAGEEVSFVHSKLAYCFGARTPLQSPSACVVCYNRLSIIFSSFSII